MTVTPHLPEDAAAVRLVAESASGRVIGATVANVARAWRTSWARAGMKGTVPHESPVERVRVGAGIALVAALVALLLPLAGTRPEPLLWMVPAATGLVALLVLWFARPRRRETMRA